MHKMLIAMAMIATLPMSALAATKLQPGLWETTVLMNLGEGMPQVPPEMRAQMKQMGLDIPGVDPITHRVCITPEQAARETMPNVNDPESGCRMVGSKRDGDRFTADLVCDGRMKGKGNMTMTLNGPKAHTGRMAFKGTSEEGMPLDMSSEVNGKWLAAECGQVQPYKE